MTAADKAEWRQSWSVVLGAAAGMGTGVALYLYVASIFIEPLREEFGWTRGDLGIGGMVSFVTGAVALPLIGRFTDRLGFRRVAIVCAVGLASIYALNTLQTGEFYIYLALMIGGGVFGGGTASIVYTRPVIATFARQRGLAQAVTDTDAVAPEAADVTFRQALRRGRFWLLIAAIACINIPGSGVLGQLAPLVSDTGLPDGEVAIVMSIYAGGLLVGRLITGFALDRFPAAWVGAITTAVPAIGIVLLMAPEPSFALAALAVALIGAQQGAEVDLFAYFISRSFGLKHYGAIYGVIAMAGALSTAIALVAFGQVHDITGSYDIALSIGAVLFCLGALAFAMIGRQSSDGA